MLTSRDRTEEIFRLASDLADREGLLGERRIRFIHAVGGAILLRGAGGFSIRLVLASSAIALAIALAVLCEVLSPALRWAAVLGSIAVALATAFVAARVQLWRVEHRSLRIPEIDSYWTEYLRSVRPALTIAEPDLLDPRPPFNKPAPPPVAQL